MATKEQATKEQRDLVEMVIFGTRRNTITWKGKGDKLSAVAVLDYIESQREIQISLLKKEKEPHYKMVFNFEDHNSRGFFGVNCSEYQPLGSFGSYMFEIDSSSANR